MKKMLFVLAALAAVPAFSSTPAAAVERRFCISSLNDGPLLCYYDTYAQCQATASGTFQACRENPAFAAQSYYGYGDQPPVRVRRHHRRVD